jgi:hypothetical protein
MVEFTMTESIQVPKLTMMFIGGLVIVLVLLALLKHIIERKHSVR